MRWSVAVAMTLLPLAGCTGSVEDAPVTEAVDWEPGFWWTFAPSGEGPGAPARMELLGEGSVAGRAGHFATVESEGAPVGFGLWLAGPEALSQQILPPAGSPDAFCRDEGLADWRLFPDGEVGGPGQSPAPALLRFPLAVGASWEDVTFIQQFTDAREEPAREGVIWTVQQGQVTGYGPVTVPAGTFDAYRVEIRAWHDTAMADLPAWATTPTRKEAMDASPLMVLHFAPEVRNVVRWEHALKGEHVPGMMTAQPAHLTDDRQASELTAFGLEARPGLPGDRLLEHAAPFCADLVAGQAPQPYLHAMLHVHEYPANAPGTLSVSAQTLTDLEEDKLRYQWSLEGVDGVVATGTTPTWSAEVSDVDRYTLRLTVEDPDSGLQAEGRTSFATYAASTSTTSCSGLSALEGCMVASLPVGRGVGLVQADLAGEAVGSRVGGKLVLLDAAGSEVVRDERGLFTTTWRLEAEPDWARHAPGTWTLVWWPEGAGDEVTSTFWAQPGQAAPQGS